MSRKLKWQNAYGIKILAGQDCTRQIEINNLHANLIGCILKEGLLASPSLKRVQYIFCILFKTEMLQCIKQHTTIKLQRYWNTNNRVWERTIVLPVHCKDKIKITKICGSDRPGYWGDLNPPLLWSCSHPWVCLITLNPRKTSLALMPSLIWINIQKSTVNIWYNLMIPNGTSRVYEKLGVKPTLVYEGPEHSFSRRTPANISCTHNLHQIAEEQTDTNASITQIPPRSTL